MEVDVNSVEAVEAVASRLRQAFNDVGYDYPAMTKFLVRIPDSNRHEIEIGIQLEDVNQKYADDLADEILDALISRVSSSGRGEDDRSTVALNQSSTLEFA